MLFLRFFFVYLALKFSPPSGTRLQSHFPFNILFGLPKSFLGISHA